MCRTTLISTVDPFFHSWICRNVALLLFATLITRAFNARRINIDRDPVSLARRLTTDDFFGRYPSLEKVLLAELERGWRESQDAQAVRRFLSLEPRPKSS